MYSRAFRLLFHKTDHAIVGPVSSCKVQLKWRGMTDAQVQVHRQEWQQVLGNHNGCDSFNLFISHSRDWSCGISMCCHVQILPHLVI